MAEARPHVAAGPRRRACQRLSAPPILPAGVTRAGIHLVRLHLRYPQCAGRCVEHLLSRHRVDFRKGRQARAVTPLQRWRARYRNRPSWPASRIHGRQMERPDGQGALSCTAHSSSKQVSQACQLRYNRCHSGQLYSKRECIDLGAAAPCPPLLRPPAAHFDLCGGLDRIRCAARAKDQACDRWNRLRSARNREGEIRDTGRR
jgi:hypothetical protein